MKEKKLYAGRMEPGSLLDRLVHEELIGPVLDEEPIPPFSTNWDAARTLVPRLGEFALTGGEGGFNVVVTVPRDDQTRIGEAFGPTKELALCRAILKSGSASREAQGED